MQPDSATLRVYTRHTADLGLAERTQARALLEGAFGGDFTEHDWENALGGMHVLAFQGVVMVGHASVVQRRLLHNGRALRCGYIEGFGVHPSAQGLGVGARLMDEAEHVIRNAYVVGALSTTREARGLYETRGWIPWRGRTYALTPQGVMRTPDEDDGVFVLVLAEPLDVEEDLVCDFRDGDLW